MLLCDAVKLAFSADWLDDRAFSFATFSLCSARSFASSTLFSDWLYCISFAFAGVELASPAAITRASISFGVSALTVVPVSVVSGLAGVSALAVALASADVSISAGVSSFACFPAFSSSSAFIAPSSELFSGN